MSSSVESLVNREYKYGFVTDIESETAPRGLSEDVIHDVALVKLQMVGLPFGTTRAVIRGKVEDNRFSVFHFAGDRLLAIDSVNRAADHMVGRRLLAAGISPSPEICADESVDLKALVAKVTSEA